MLSRHICVLATTVLIVGACGGDSDGDESGASGTASNDDANGAETPEVHEAEDEVDDATMDALADAEAIAEDIVDGLEAVQESEGGGGATLTVNGQAWEFPAVLCAFGEDQIGQPGAVFNLSAIADGVQLYVSIDDSGAAHSLSLNDIEDFENPSVSLSVNQFVATVVGAPVEFLTLDGNQVTADVVMIDDLTSQPTADSAELSATCP